MKIGLQYILIMFSFLTFSSNATATDAKGKVVVNGEVVIEKQLSQLRNKLRIPANTPIMPGKYWYDKRSGFWGIEGGPTVGWILPGLDIGGTLRADASGGGKTGVFFNGREIHPTEVIYLRSLLGVVYQGRFWLNGQGFGGYEGGPALFNLWAAAAAGSSKGGYTRRTPFGGLGGDGNCSYYMHPGGSSVMTCN